MRAPAPSEPNSTITFPTYQVPEVSAMRGSAALVQELQGERQQVAAAGVRRGGRAVPPKSPPQASAAVGSAISVINGSSRNGAASTSRRGSNLRMQSVTDNCLLNSVTVPKNNNNNDNDNIITSNNEDVALISKSAGALKTTTRDRNDDDGQHIPPYQKADDLETIFNDDNGDDKELIDLNATIIISSIHCDDAKICVSATTTQYLDDRRRTVDELGFAPPLRLRGGGESSISAGTTGWGTPPSQQASNNNGNSGGWGAANSGNQSNTGTQQWTNNTNRPPAPGPGNPQDASKPNSTIAQNGQPTGPASQSTNNSWNKPPGATVGPPGPVPAPINPAVPTTPGGAPPPPNTTKQQLEQLTNMREAIFSQDGWGGQHVNQDTNWDIPGSPEPQLKMEGGAATPAWKPNVNNGTELWEANLRNGGQPPPQPQQKAPWGHTPSTNIGGTWGEDDDTTDSSNVWTGVPPAQQPWGGSNAGGNAGGGGGNTGGVTTMWGGPKKENDWAGNVGSNAGGWGDPRSADPRAAGMDPRDMRPDPRDIRAGSTDPMRMLDPREQMRLVGGDMRGDPRGITGRLNGAGAEAFWGQSGPQTSSHHIHQPKIMGPGNTSGWEEPSPPSQRRNVPPNYDDGTSLWGNPQQGGVGGGGMGRNSAAGPPGMPQSRMKPDGSVWGGHGRNGSWDDSGPAWEESGPWPKQKTMPGPLWDNEGDWPHKQGPKQQLTKEMVWNSRQFRTLVDMGYKKEDVENALRLRDMNIDEALDMLGSLRNQNLDGWRGRHDDHYDHPQFPSQRFQTGPGGQMNFPPGGGNGPNVLNNIHNAPGGANASLMGMSPAIVQKMLSQNSGSQGFGGANPSGGRSNLQQPSQPSTAQLRMLVQQIQMAVQAGYLNHQILNQPLAPQTLVLLNQLLQQIKNLQQLVNQQNMAQQQQVHGVKSSAFLQCSVLMTKTKQQITNLQNQIAAQQAIYVKQQHNMGSGGPPSDLFKPNAMHDSINSLQNNFVDLGLKDTQMQSQQQSRLNQWKLPAIDKEEGGEFSRAPGSVSKSLVPSHSSPNLNNPLGLTQPDGPWSSGRSADTGWPDTGAVDSVSQDVKDSQWATPAQSLTDLVPEFEPGKPWKGTQMKSIEDDPSMTPGSVVRSPLSIATIKDNELFNMGASKSPPLGSDALPPLSLSSSTWTFNPPSSTSTMISSPQNKLPTSKGALGDLNTPTAVTSELWGAPKPRGPPPGLSAKGSIVNGWSSNIGGNSAPWGGAAQRNWAPGGGSPWVLLRNLTAQIDGSTLRTLCMQHGPLQSFHLYLHQGFALIKYSSREEATKAQTALNNCVLGNTTILAENPSEWEASLHLQQVANSQGGSTNSWRGSAKPTGGDTWSSGWPNSTTSSLWGSGGLDASDQSRATPSSLNSYLPGDLLGGESM